MSFVRVLTLFVCCVGLAACQTTEVSNKLPEGQFSKEVVKKVRIGKPYTIRGKRYYPEYNPTYDETGIASWYGPGFHGKKTANGETYDQYAMTAAHTTLPLPSLVRVTRESTGQSIIVRINDRGPFADGRIIDLSKKAAQTLGIKGIDKVRVTYLKEETERYWASNNVRPTGLPIQQDPPRIVAKYDRYQNDSVQGDAAPIMSVSSMQVVALDAPELPQPMLKSQPYSGDTPTPSEPQAVSLQSANWNGPREMADNASPSITYQDNTPYEAPRQDASVELPPPIRGYLIQAGAFSSQANANRLVGKLAHVGNAYVDRMDRAAGVLYRVRLGPYQSQAQASDFLHELFKLGIKDATVVAAK